MEKRMVTILDELMKCVKMWYRFSHVLNLWAEIKIKYSLCTDYSNVGLTLALYEISEK